MARIMAIDIGGKRTGIAVTDPFQIIATGLTTIPSATLISFLSDYFKKESVERFVIGMPKSLNDADTHATPIVKAAILKLQKAFPAIPITEVDERFTSLMAKEAMLEMGLKKKERRKKELVDEIAATLMLRDYLQSTSIS